MKDTPIVVKSHDIHLDKEYSQWMYEIKERYRHTQVRAAVKVNAEQLMFNWLLGKDLVTRKVDEKWGAGVVEQVSLDLQNEFPSAKGFSTTNLWNMKKWYLFYSENIQQLAGENYDDFCINQLKQYSGDVVQKLQQIVGEIDFPAIFAFVPWGHHVQIITKCKDVDEALFYIKGTINEGWSRNALVNCIKADYYHKKGAAITNFDRYLTASQSKLAKEITK